MFETRSIKYLHQTALELQFQKIKSEEIFLLSLISGQDKDIFLPFDDHHFLMQNMQLFRQLFLKR